MSYDIIRLDMEDVLSRYNLIKVSIDRALSYSSGEWTTSQIIRNCIADPSYYQIWEVVENGETQGFGSTRVIDYPNFTAMHVMTFSGRTSEDFQKWSERWDEILKEHPNIDIVELTGRRGWVKKLEKLGYTERYTTMRKSFKETIDV